MITSADIRENDRIDRLKAWAPQITKPDLGKEPELHHNQFTERNPQIV